MCMFNNKEFSISKQATIRDTDAGKRFSSSSNAAACFLSNPEGVYLFILSDLYKGGKRWHLVRGPGEEVEDGIGFCSPIILATGIRQTGGGGQLKLGKRGYAVIYVEEIVFV